MNTASGDWRRPRTDRLRSAVPGLALAVILTLGFVSAAHADIVRLSNGRIMTVEMARFEGQTVVLVMRGGGEIHATRDMVLELLPDEVPFARTVAIEALAGSPSAVAPPLSVDAIRDLVTRIATRVGLDVKLAQAVVRVESNYKPLAVSTRGAMGLMQIMPVIVRQYAVDDPFDPERNLEAGMRHLMSLMKRLDIRRALAAYNAGESAVTRYGGVPPYRETQNYVSRIMTAIR